MEMNEVKLHVKTWMDLINMMLNERSHIHYMYYVYVKFKHRPINVCYETEQ